MAKRKRRAFTKAFKETTDALGTLIRHDRAQRGVRSQKPISPRYSFWSERTLLKSVT